MFHASIAPLDLFFISQHLLELSLYQNTLFQDCLIRVCLNKYPPGVRDCIFTLKLVIGD